MLPLRDNLRTRRVAWINYALIAANVAIFINQQEAMLAGADPRAVIAPWVLVPAALVTHPSLEWPALFTHLFLHGSLGHIGGNMLFLWIFGDNVEDAMGHVRYFIFYVACGVLAALAQVSVSTHSWVPMLGASGAIAGVLAAFLTIYPGAPITVINPIPLLWLVYGPFMSFPAWLVIIEFFVLNLWSALQPASGAGGVAFMAHVGGFITGLLLRPLFTPHLDRVEHDRWERWVTRSPGRR